MSRHWGIAAAILTLALAACTQSGEPDPPLPNTSRPSVTLATPPTGVTVARPKRVDENTPCQQVITVADVSAATGANATLSTISSPVHCLYSLTKTDGSDWGRLTASLFGDRTVAPTNVTTLAGNPAVEQPNGLVGCNFFVVLDGNKRLDAEGAALSVTVESRDLENPCKVARELVEKGFARLPDA